MSNVGDWTAHDEDKPRCGNPPGPVDSSEELACFLVRQKTDEISLDAIFTRSRLQPRSGFSDKCGESDGASVQRRRDDDEDEILKRADEHAARKEGRVSEGAALASVAQLRTILRSDGSRAVYVYDDAGVDDPLHAVIRIVPVSRPEFDDIRSQVVASFARRLSPRR